MLFSLLNFRQEENEDGVISFSALSTQISKIPKIANHQDFRVWKLVRGIQNAPQISDKYSTQDLFSAVKNLRL